MTNIYDIINGLYNDDEGWNAVLNRKYAEQFLRTEAFRGATDEELLEIWGQVMYLLIYCGNTFYRIGDMTGKDFVYCISWCQRNVADFELDYDSVDKFLSVMERLLSFLKQKRAITSDSAATKCKSKLLGAGKTVNLFNADGSLPEEYEKFRINREPDLQTKVFMQMGQKLSVLSGLFRNFFNGPEYEYERRRAVLLFFGTDTVPDEKEKPDLTASFWEYFAFDFRLGETNRRPIEVFSDHYRANPDPGYEKTNHALVGLLEALVKVRLMVFTIEAEDVDRWYRCRDFFSGSMSELNLPLDGTVDFTHLLCVAHVFEDGNLLTDYLRSVNVKPVARRVLHKNFVRLLDWYRVSEPEAGWEEFCDNNASLVIHMISYAGTPDSVVEPFRWSTNVKDYKPVPVDMKQDVCLFILRMCRSLHVSWQDRKNLLQMWSDFYALAPVSCFDHQEFILWALATLENYMIVTDTFLLDIASFVKKMNLTGWRIREKANMIHTVLRLEPYDPRYNSESAFISMVFS